MLVTERRAAPFLLSAPACQRPEAALLAKTPKRKKPNGQHAPNNCTIPYEEAVAEGCKINEQMKRDERLRNMRLGELAARVERKYGDRTKAKFAKEIGVAPCTLSRYRKVWQAWDGGGIVAPGPTSYTVMRELKDHPDREKIVKENPQITKREAEKLRREHEETKRPEGKLKRRKGGDWPNEEKKSWLRKVLIQANDIIRTTAGVVVTPDVLEIVEPALLSALRDSIAAQQSLLAQLEQQLEHQNEQDAELEVVA